MALFDMTQMPSSSAQVAALTALANAGITMANMDATMFRLAAAYCDGNATFFGVSQNVATGRVGIHLMFDSIGLDHEAMLNHYATLLYN